MHETENAGSASYLFSLFYKTKKKRKDLLILGVNQGIQIIGLLRSMYVVQSMSN